MTIAAATDSATDADTDARTRHYGDFYGLTTPPGDGDIALVVGNCQAESLRIMLDGGGIHGIRMPPVHELVAADLPHLDRWLGRAGILISQPIRDDYHGLPLGTRQLAERLSPGAASLTFPVVRFAGLYPTHAIVRPPSDASLVPPLVEYHDLRVLAEAAGRPAPAPPLDVSTTKAIAEHSLDQLRRREEAHDTIPVSDLFAHPGFESMRTLNHPGNSVWSTVAARVRERLGLAEHVVDPGRPLLNGVHAPREQAVIDAFGLADEARDQWIVGGRTIPTADVRDAHLAWYAEHPDVVTAGLVRHREALALLGLS